MLYFIGHCTHHVLPLAQSWWCFPHWVLIRQRPQRNYRKEHHRWRRSTPQPNLRPKEGLGMSSSLPPANDEDNETAIKNHKGKICQRIQMTGAVWILPQLMCLTGGCCLFPRLPAAFASPGTEFHALTSGKRALQRNTRQRRFRGYSDA